MTEERGVALTTDYIITRKFEKWCEYFLDSNNKETFGNATKSALKVYNTESYPSASNIGYQNVRKLENIGALYADKRGLSLGKMIDIAAKKTIETDNPAWWDRLMKVLGYEKYLISQTVFQQNNQFNQYNNLTDEQLEQTIRSKYSKIRESGITTSSPGEGTPDEGESS